MLWEEVISELLMHPAYYVNENLPSIQGLNKVMQLQVPMNGDHEVKPVTYVV